MEEIIKKQGERGLEQLLFYYGLDLDLLRQQKNDVYSKVHKENAGGPVSKVKGFKGILQNDDFFQSNNNYAGGFEAGFLYTKDPDVMVGDIIAIQSSDVKLRRYKIVKRLAVGQTLEIFTKWEISAIAD
jgi:hypothetical protein